MTLAIDNVNLGRHKGHREEKSSMKNSGAGSRGIAID